MLKQLRLFVKENMELIWIAVGTAFLSATVGLLVASTNVAITLLTTLILDIVAILSGLVCAGAYTKAAGFIRERERKADKEREVAVAAYQKFIDMNTPQGGQYMTIPGRLKEIEALENHKEKKDATP